MKRTAAFLTLFLFAFLAVCGAFAEDTLSTEKPVRWVTGTVASPSGETLAGVTVTTARGETATTGADGQYRLEVTYGQVELTFTLQKYETGSASVHVDRGQTGTADCTLEPVKSQVSGVVSDATNSSVTISGVTVTCGETTVQTDSQGRYSFRAEAGTRQVTFSKDGYYPVTDTVQVPDGGQDAALNASLSHCLNANEYRVVLKWGRSPADLDSHLVGISGGSSCHVWYSSPISGNANLDVDDRDGEGPETTTFTISSDGTYYFFVHNYSGGSTKLSESGAWLEVYTGDSDPVRIDVPEGSGTKRWWYVFRIENGQMIQTNEFVTNPNTALPNNVI